MRTTATGLRSQRPPPKTVPAPPATGTLLMETEPSSGGLAPTLEEGPRVATTAQGTVRDAGKTLLADKRATPLVWAIAVVAVAAVAAAAWALGQATAPAPGSEVQVPLSQPSPASSPQPQLTPQPSLTASEAPPATTPAPPPPAPQLPVPLPGKKKLKDIQRDP
jgi:hypothetical protein